MNKRVVMQLSDIKVSRAFCETTPKQAKLNAVRQYYQENGKLDKDIIVDKTNRLQDGYIRLLVLKEYGIEEFEVVKDVTTYVFGKHDSNDKEYCWKITTTTKQTNNLKVGNKMLVRTRGGKSIATITRFIETEKPPINKLIRRVIKIFDEMEVE